MARSEGSSWVTAFRTPLRPASTVGALLCANCRRLGASSLLGTDSLHITNGVPLRSLAAAWPPGSGRGLRSRSWSAAHAYGTSET